ncbi:MAG: hypothetical protein ACRCWI_05155 [Brevinema sp.]
MITLLSYSQSPLQGIKPYLEDFVLVLDEKFTDFAHLEGEELWLDAYIDLYDPRLIKPEYLYQFFARIHQICDEVPIHRKRILINYFYSSSFIPLNKVFYLYKAFSEFFIKAYQVLPIYIPDILNKQYYYHPYNQLQYADSIMWKRSSLFRVIHGNDIISNLRGYSLNHEAVILSGIQVSFLDLCNKVEQIFGKKNIQLENAYDIYIEEPTIGQILSEINYNLESSLITQI